MEFCISSVLNECVVCEYCICNKLVAGGFNLGPTSGIRAPVNLVDAKVHAKTADNGRDEGQRRNGDAELPDVE